MLGFDEILSDYCSKFDIERVGDLVYCRNLYDLAESVEATNIVECGFGWGFSAMSFIASLSKRHGKLVSIDPFNEPDHLAHKPERNLAEVKKVADNVGVDYTLHKSCSGHYTPSGPYCMVYVDANPYLAGKDFDYFEPYVRDGGLIVLDGYPGMWPVKNAVDEIGKPFIIKSYSDINGHAVFSL